jgi:hypothetical protein
MLFVDLTRCTECRPERNRCVKTLLSGLLGGAQDLER